MDFRISAASDSTVMSDWDLEKRNKWLQYPTHAFKEINWVNFIYTVVQTLHFSHKSVIHVQQMQLIALSRQIEVPDRRVCPSPSFIWRAHLRDAANDFGLSGVYAILMSSRAQDSDILRNGSKINPKLLPKAHFHPCCCLILKKNELLLWQCILGSFIQAWKAAIFSLIVCVLL